MTIKANPLSYFPSSRKAVGGKYHGSGLKGAPGKKVGSFTENRPSKTVFSPLSPPRKFS